MLDLFSTYAGKAAVICGDIRLDYSELGARASAMAENLQRRGLRPGDLLGVYCSPSTEFVALLAACVHSSIVVCPLSTRLPEAAAAEHLKRLDARFLVSDKTLRGLAVGRIPIGDLCMEAPGGHALKPPGPPSDTGRPATIIMTSGSSGQPKAVVHSLANHLASARAANANMPLRPGERWLLSLPLYHVAGLGVLFRCFVAGAAVVVPAPGEGLVDAIKSRTVTHVSLVPTQLHRMLREDRPLKALMLLRGILMGGAPMPPSLVEEAVGHGLAIHTSYGMTETAAQIVCTRPGDTFEHLLTSGRSLALDTVSISDGGEIQVRGEALFQGYLSPGGALDRPLLTPEDWFQTGDLGHLDPDGYLHVTGRKDNMFISGGENIQPEEIEAALLQIEGVAQAMVVPKDDDGFGQRPVAFVEMDEEFALDPEEILRELEGSLPRFRLPVGLYRWPECVGEGMKPSRPEFEQLANSATLSREARRGGPSK
jgi:O-succinylbenzoic acid--CoA ligase